MNKIRMIVVALSLVGVVGAANATTSAPTPAAMHKTTTHNLKKMDVVMMKKHKRHKKHKKHAVLVKHEAKVKAI